MSDVYKLFNKLSLVTPFIMLMAMLFPRDNSTWAFDAGQGMRFDGNSKYLYLFCEKKSAIRNVWISSDSEVVSSLQSQGLEAYHENSILAKFFLLRSGVCFSTHGPNYWKYLMSANLIFLHHGIPLKLMNEDDPDESASLIHRYGDPIYNRYFLTTSMGSPFSLFQSSYNLDKEQAIIGRYPRTDPFFTDIPNSDIRTNKQSLYELKQKGETNKIAMYAPTFRKDISGEKNGVDYFLEKANLQLLDQILGQEDIFLYISLHPRRSTRNVSSCYENMKVLDTGDDIYPYLAHCDLLITDYSSIFYDFLLLDRPILFFAPDIDRYKKTQGMYFEYQDHVPGPVIKNISELVFHLCRDDLMTIGQPDRTRMVEDYYTKRDTRPSKEVLDNILDQVSGLSEE